MIQNISFKATYMAVTNQYSNLLQEPIMRVASNNTFNTKLLGEYLMRRLLIPRNSSGLMVHLSPLQIEIEQGEVPGTSVTIHGCYISLSSPQPSSIDGHVNPYVHILWIFRCVLHWIDE